MQVITRTSRRITGIRTSHQRNRSRRHLWKSWQYLPHCWLYWFFFSSSLICLDITFIKFFWWRIYLSLSLEFSNDTCVYRNTFGIYSIFDIFGPFHILYSNWGEQPYLQGTQGLSVCVIEVGWDAITCVCCIHKKVNYF